MESFDFIIIGSGFGGSVSAYRLSQKGYRVAVIENGKRFKPSELPKTDWNTSKIFWAPFVGMRGILQISMFKNITVLHGTGVGGGSLVYGGVLLRPSAEVFDAPYWPKGFDWKNGLAPYFDKAEKMLGVKTTPVQGDADKEFESLAALDRSMNYRPTRVGILFSEKKENQGQKVQDPYFDGEGPDRSTCTLCGGCMSGCNIGAKNTLDFNYLYLAEKLGAKVFPNSLVTEVIPLDNGNERYIVKTKSASFLGFSFGTRELKAKNVIFAAGVLGTLKLLFLNKKVYKNLPKISDSLGMRALSNGENLICHTSSGGGKDFSSGVSIGSYIQVGQDGYLEPLRFGPGSGSLRLMMWPRWPEMKKLFGSLMKLLSFASYSKRTIMAMCMNTADQSFQFQWGRSIFSFFTQSLVTSNSQLPRTNEFAHKMSLKLSAHLDSAPQDSLPEKFWGAPITAHILGGCMMGTDLHKSVCSPQQEIHNYPGLYICDASVVPVNLGVNPALTVTAMAEKFTDQFPSRKVN